MATRSTKCVVGFVDIDAFECQLWQRDAPQFRNMPCVVMNSSGRIVSVTYEAKAMGVSRGSTPNIKQARKVCPSLHAFIKPTVWGKPDSVKTREGTWEVLDCIKEYCSKLGDGITVELASSDELYLDISAAITRGMERRSLSGNWAKPIMMPAGVVLETSRETVKGPFQYSLERTANVRDYTHYVRREEERLVFGALFMSKLCEELERKTGLSSSAGVASNKLLAKVGCGLNKPGKVTICPSAAMSRVSTLASITSLPGLGGKKGEMLMKEFNIKLISELRGISLGELEGLFEGDLPQQIFSWARGNDHQAVVSKCMKDGMRCNKPMQDITNLNQLTNALQNLRSEIESNLEREKSRHQRVARELHIEFTFLTEGGLKESDRMTFSVDDGGQVFKDLPEKAFEYITSRPNLEKNKVNIVELAVAVKEFHSNSNDAVDSLLEQFFDMKLDNNLPNRFLRVQVRPQNLGVPSFSNRQHVGSFRTTKDGKYSNKNLALPKLIPSSSFSSLIETYLGTEYKESKPTMIIDHNSYYELKHRCFIQWLKEFNFMGKVKSTELKKPDFIGFGGRFTDPMRSPAVRQFGDWEIYAVNVGDIIYLWDEKQPQRPSIESYYGTYFEKLLTQPEGEKTEPGINEFDKIYVVNQMQLDKHSLLVVSEVDAENENGDWVEVNMSKEAHVRAMEFKKLKLWSQSIVPGVEHFVLGTRNALGTLKKIEAKTIDDVTAPLGNQPVRCLEFQNRFLSFIKAHLKTSGMKVVKKFSWVCGARDVVCGDVHVQEIPNLVFPRLYTAYLKDLNVDLG